MAWLWPGLHLHDKSSDDGPHEGYFKAVNAELKEVHQEAEKVCQGISGGRSDKDQGDFTEEDFSQAGEFSTFQVYPLLQDMSEYVLRGSW